MSKVTMNNGPIAVSSSLCWHPLGRLLDRFLSLAAVNANANRSLNDFSSDDTRRLYALPGTRNGCRWNRCCHPSLPKGLK